MLVLSRKKSESILIGDGIEIMVVDVRGDGKVRLGIAAPRNVPVHRREVYEAIQRQKQEAGGAGGAQDAGPGSTRERDAGQEGRAA